MLKLLVIMYSVIRLVESMLLGALYQIFEMMKKVAVLKKINKIK